MGCASSKGEDLAETHIEFINTSHPIVDITSPREDNIIVLNQPEENLQDSNLKVSQLGFQPKALPAIPTLKQLDKEIKQQSKKVAVKQLVTKPTIQIQNYPQGILVNKITEAIDIIHPNSLHFLIESQMEPEEQAMLAWKLISSNYEQEDPTVTLQMCEQALVGIFGFVEIVQKWIVYQKQYFCVDKSKFIRIFIALHLLTHGESIHRLVYTGKSADDDVWSLFQFINCNSLHGKFVESQKQLTFDEYTSTLKSQYYDESWLLQLLNLSKTNTVTGTKSSLQFMLTRIQIIDDLDFLAQMIYYIANAFQETLIIQKQLLINIFNAETEFIDFIFPELCQTSQQFYLKLQLLYFNYLQIDQLHYSFENMTQKELFGALNLPITPSQSYDVTSMILSQKYQNIAGLLNISKFNTKKRRIHNLSAMSKTAQIVHFEPFSLVEFQQIHSPEFLYNFTCTLCSAQELPISQAVNLIESVFGPQEQIRLLASLISQKTDLVLEIEDFNDIFRISRNFSEGKKFCSEMKVLYLCGIGALDQSESTEKQLQMALKLCQAEELTFLCDIIQGVNYNSNIIVPNNSYIFKGIQSQDQIDDCIEPFFSLLEANQTRMVDIGKLFKRLFSASNYIVQRLENSELERDRDALSAFFIVSFYKSVGVSPALHALNGDELDCEIANDMLNAIGVQIDSEARSIDAFSLDIKAQCEDWVVELFC
ncbi:hypothetical protein SS50377_22376 [Spironucleus salmonicida]|uniref:Uncharacterized protein n=1 Tax=Spironucleus salmonicida TaxID=348837 RepID=V6LN33_9EUKA|nr:hypothetical protein SS50377_22376 [Spironucleus salmonicida]|eukprot:EST42129.1 Hypothetical protein SS50377_18437 [Spironucleus salmonicida]